MREAFGNLRLVAPEDQPGTLALEAIGLHRPAPIRRLANGDPVPFDALKPHIGKVLQVNALLPLIDGQLNELELLPADIQESPVELPLSPIWVSCIGNMGGEATPNPRGDRISFGLAYSNREDDTSGSWLKCSARKANAFAPIIQKIQPRSRVTVCGSLSTYLYEGSERTELEIRAIAVNYSTSSNRQLLSARSDDEAMPMAAAAADDSF